MRGWARRPATRSRPSLREPGFAAAACYPPSTLDCDIRQFEREGSGKICPRARRTLGRVTGEISDPWRRVDEARHSRMACAMLLCDRHRIGDIARIHDLGGGHLAAPPERSLGKAGGGP